MSLPNLSPVLVKELFKYACYLRLNKDLNVLEASEAFCSLLKYKSLSSNHHLLQFSADYQDSAMSSEWEIDGLIDQLKERPAIRSYWTWKTKDDKLCYSTITLIRQNDDLHFFISDLSALKNAYDSLQSDHYILQESLNFFPQLFYITDADGIYLTANMRFHKLIGKKAEECVGTPIDILIPMERDKLLTHGNYYISTDSFKYKDKKLWFKTFCHKILNQDGEPYAFGHISIDITQEKVLEKKIEQAREENFAKSKLATLGEMAGGIAHEINNPMAIIQANAKLIEKMLKKQNVNDPKTLKCIKEIEQTIDRVAKIISGLRTIARDGTKDLPISLSIGQLLEEVMALSQQKIKNHEIELIIDVDDLKDLKVWANHVQLSQVLLNLISNATYALQEQENAQLHIAGHRPDEDSIRITITDNGPGIPEELARKVFQPFFTTKPVGEGTGLGLSLSKSIIEKHQGKLYLTSQESGTCFTIELPIHLNNPGLNDPKSKSD